MDDLEIPSNGRNAVPPPYGTPMQLHVLKSFCNLPAGRPVQATMITVYTITMSPVMDVTVRTASGSEIRAALKVYDRRLGRDLRECLGKHVAHTPEVETAFQYFVKAKKMAPFLRELARRSKEDFTPPEPWHFLDDAGPDCQAEFEAALWAKCDGYFKTETEAYDRLCHLQGEYIPRMLAHVRVIVPVPNVPADLGKYFELKGVLLERISGYNLGDLPISPLAPSDPKKWPSIIQSSVNLAHKLDASGVLMGDCAPRNVIVDKRTHMPFFIDFAQAEFKEILLQAWHDPKDKGWNPEYEYWKTVATRNNPGAIGTEMKGKLKKIKNMELKGIVYPNYESILKEIQQPKKGQKLG
ncbi:uncharacterized protein B0H64DRAFT_432949 [Chaetomium fimeti]|uniref:Protein kinase domain-containing protein n=1 Tax=Chaetomium fimeti TaxID=1854472 RepID=A0AAE0HGY5_9PEZI|nr:hypothetical protein B0H64DRAFT_432949 [Chaetomium fimeti]